MLKTIRATESHLWISNQLRQLPTLSNKETEKLCKVMLKILYKWQLTSLKIADAAIFHSLRQICLLITFPKIILSKSLENCLTSTET